MTSSGHLLTSRRPPRPGRLRYCRGQTFHFPGEVAPQIGNLSERDADGRCPGRGSQKNPLTERRSGGGKSSPPLRRDSWAVAAHRGTALPIRCDRDHKTSNVAVQPCPPNPLIHRGSRPLDSRSHKRYTRSAIDPDDQRGKVNIELSDSRRRRVAVTPCASRCALDRGLPRRRPGPNGGRTLECSEQSGHVGQPRLNGPTASGLSKRRPTKCE